MMDMLKTQGIIAERVFALLFSNTSFTKDQNDTYSECIIGQEASDYMSNSLLSIPTLDTANSWAVYLPTVYLGLINLTISTHIASFDSNLDLIHVPNTDFLALIEGFSAYGSCKSTTNSIVCDCFRYPAASYPDLTLTLGDYNLTWTYEDYFKQENGECVLLVERDLGLQRWALGTAWMRNRVLVFDVEGRKVGFGQAAAAIMSLAICFLCF